ncbi:MAG: hypothetical protein HXX09_16085 [Bacteroidetes bacterium]|nr:hypothetical protein [Bacteroidota bacterium]
MTDASKYVSKSDFHHGKQFVKINKHIDTCLTLLERLILYNNECRNIVAEKLNIPDHIKDYRLDQFGYYENTLRSVYYSCFSLKYIYDISTFMNFKRIENTIGETLDNQIRYITFTSIVKMSSIFEFTRKVYEKNITRKNYFDNLIKKYSDKGVSLKLLSDFRNTIHSNGIWNPDNKKDTLQYYLREGIQIIMPGEHFKYDNWQIYRIFKDCLELNKIMALDNEALRVRETRLEINGQKLYALKTDITEREMDNIFNKNNKK